MRALRIRIPHPAIGSRIPDDRLPRPRTPEEFWGKPQDPLERLRVFPPSLRDFGSRSRRPAARELVERES